MSTTAILLLAILGLGFLITFQIAKASEYVGVLKGENKTFEQSNRVNAFLMVVFLILGLIGIYWCHSLYYHKTLLPYPSASDHGEKIDNMMFITIAITGGYFARIGREPARSACRGGTPELRCIRQIAGRGHVLGAKAAD